MTWEQMGQQEALYIVAFLLIVELLLTFPSQFTIWDILIMYNRSVQFCLPRALIWLAGLCTRDRAVNGEATARPPPTQHKIQATF